MIVVVSDIHLGTAHIPTITPPDRKQFKNFLRYLRDDLRPDHLVLNGDIDDLWRRNIRTITRENYDIYNLLAELRARPNPIKVHYILGNHDWYAQRDRAGKMSKYIDKYYDIEYKEMIPTPTEKETLRTHGTTYAFRHGHQFDEEQLHPWIFNQLALADGDAIGEEMEYSYMFYKQIGKSYKEIRSESLTRSAKRIADLISDRKKGSLDEQVEKMDIAESGREDELGIAPGNSLDQVRESSVDWLCLGHTHRAGIKADPTSANGGVANSGAWKGGTDTYLILEESPRLMDWNDGNPIERKQRTLSDRLLDTIRDR